MMGGLIRILLFTLTLLIGQGSTQGPIVDIPGLGSVMGDTKLSYFNERLYYTFLGMPFVAQPVGPNLRFQPAGPVEPWQGVLNATSKGNRCPQLTVEAGNVTSDESERISLTEDCLYINVETPQPVQGANLPVLIFYHGGAFMGGSSLIYDGRKFMDFDLVMAVPHYRLGPIGFMSLDTDDIPGNIGMIDQVMALQWVIDHISVFGGDPTRITIMGQSAGGASVSLHNVSPLSTGLFQQYIPHSGAATAEWAIDRANIYAATEIGKQLGCAALDISTLTTCFQYADVYDLLSAHARFQEIEILAGRNPFAGTSPVIQKAGTMRFLIEDPRVTLENKNYIPHPAILGATKHDGTLVYSILHDGYFVPNNLTDDVVYLQRNYSNTLLNFFHVQDQGESVAAMQEKAHFGDANMGNYTAMTPGMVDVYSNLFLKGPIYENALYNSQVAPTYLFSYNYNSDRDVWNFVGSDAIEGGVCHGSDLLMLFDFPVLILSAEDRQISKTMVELWSNFVIYGDPNPAINPVENVTWPQFDGSTRHGSYLRIDENWTIYTDYTLNEYFVAGDEGFPWLTDH